MIWGLYMIGFLIRKLYNRRLESLPESARKLFNQGKQYLTTGLSDGDDATDGFCTLFQVYQPLRAADESPHGLTSPSKEMSVGILNTPMRRSAPLHHLQTYVQWKAAQDLNNFYSLCLPKRQTIYIQPISTFPDFIHSFRFKSQNLSLSLFETIQAFLQIFFSGLEVLQLPPMPLEEFAGAVRSRVHPVTGTQQLCLNDLYPLLFRFLPPNGLCIMGISWTDIFPEGHNFALGEASVQDRSAVISFGRFETKGFDAKAHCDITEINGPVIWKLIKSSSHELCHLLGLQHCTFFLCAMNESSSMDEAMNQPLFLCPVCLRKLQKACGFDVLERYTLLQKFLSGLAQQFTDEKFKECLAWLDRCVAYLNS
ncbi:Archaemetzincin-2 [Plakobranchus ocellatus]|uniref:Archaemetzincin-2 n=1 Tax=Plakobranchus ocellatus TaxID=259542 RepID=A0AAV4CDV0_9GAST|nr:Archaemetzincin-2 [Plakobranchus ocellatus]